MSESYDALKDLLDHAEFSVRRAKDVGVDGPINWGDLHAVEASNCISLERGAIRTHEEYRVVIEEAAPDAIELQEFVAGELALAGWPSVKVSTEW